MRNYWPLGGILIIFILPALAALFILTFKPINFNTVEHGNFVIPQKLEILIEANKWHVIYCDASQELAMHKLHRALGPNQDRVIVKFIPQAKLKPELKLDLNDTNILIINPQGYYILGYKQGTKLNGVLQDLRRLLKYSHA